MTRLAKSRSAVATSVKAAKVPAAGEIVGLKALRTLYDCNAERVLESHLHEADRKRRAPRKYRIVKPLPTPDVYPAARDKYFTSTVRDLISAAYSELAALGSEVREAHDNLPDSLQYGGRGQQLDEAASACEAFCEPIVPADVAGLEIVFYNSDRLTSRATRAAECGAKLRAVAERLDHMAHDDACAGDKAGAIELMSQLEADADEAEALDFPGMYG